MKIYLKWLVTTLLIFITNFSFSQGNDVIIAIDNSGSISDNEFYGNPSIPNDTGIKGSVEAIIENVLECDNDNRVAVIEYGSGIYIESDFTSILSQAQTFDRRNSFVGFNDVFYNAAIIIGDALDGTSNPGIYGPIQQLNRNTSNSLVVFLFTDAFRDIGNNSSLVNPTNTAFSSNPAFEVYTDFKNNRGAKFVVVHYPPNSDAREAAASIASVGGSYVGSLEGYPLDPDGQFTTPRAYYPVTNFTLSTQILNEISQEICTISEPPCDPITNVRIENNMLSWDSTATSFDIEYFTNDRCCGTTRTPEIFQISTNVNQISIFEIMEDLGTECWGFRIKPNCSDEWQANCCVLYDTISECFESQPCDNFDELLLISQPLNNISNIFDQVNNIEATNVISGNSDIEYVATETITLLPGFNAVNGSNFVARIVPCVPQNVPLSVNSYDDFPYSYDDSNDPNELFEQEENTKMNVYPNPSDGVFKITLDNVTSGSIEIKDFSGKTIFTKSFNDQKELEINIKDKPKGLYFLRITSGENFLIEKLVKE